MAEGCGVLGVRSDSYGPNRSSLGQMDNEIIGKVSLSRIHIKTIRPYERRVEKVL